MIEAAFIGLPVASAALRETMELAHMQRPPSPFGLLSQLHKPAADAECRTDPIRCKIRFARSAPKGNTAVWGDDNPGKQADALQS